MGCDIHLYSETYKEGKWVADLAHTLTTPTPEEIEDGERPDLDTSYSGRDYGLFGLLSEGVRCDMAFAFPPKGVPADMSPEVAAQAENWEGDSHSHSYLTVLELKEKAAEMLILPDSGAQILLPRLSGLINGLPKTDNPNLAEQRIVFWFDN